MANIQTSESVLPGHPDKICDFIADSILDAHLEQDPDSRCAVEVLAKGDNIVLSGEVTSKATVDVENVARFAISSINHVGYGGKIHNFISQQAPQLNSVVNAGFAGDQGIMFGFACDETHYLLPAPIYYAHTLSRALYDRLDGFKILADGKTQVSVEYDGWTPKRIHTVVTSVQHHPDFHVEKVRENLERIIRQTLPVDNQTIILANHQPWPFTSGGIVADCGVTSRKLVVDSYGSASRIGGGGYSGKDPSKVDRSAAYKCRSVAKKLVNLGLCSRVEVCVSYVIGQSKPVSLSCNTFGTGDEKEVNEYLKTIDWRPRSIIESLDLKRPIYSKYCNFGHFGHLDAPWEK
jgi:S-adenosylmethionine synthetase